MSLVSQAMAADRPELIVVVGAPGTDEYGEQFGRWAERWGQVAEAARWDWHAIGRPDKTSGAADGKDATDVQRLRDKIATCDRPTEQPLWLVLIGHGTFGLDTAKFNLRGPDVSADELARWLSPLDRPVVVVNTSSCSGPFINALSGPRRVIVTATRSGTEQNFARFGGNFADAIGSAETDLDHDHAVSVREAFVRASAEVQRFYEAEDRLATEHALLDDNGDALGTTAELLRRANSLPPPESMVLDGQLAAKMTIDLDDQGPRLTNDQLTRRDELESELESLRRRKPEMTDEDYWAAVENVAVALARLYRSADDR